MLSAELQSLSCCLLSSSAGEGSLFVLLCASLSICSPPLLEPGYRGPQPSLHLTTVTAYIHSPVSRPGLAANLCWSMLGRGGIASPPSLPTDHATLWPHTHTTSIEVGSASGNTKPAPGSSPVRTGQERGYGAAHCAAQAPRVVWVGNHS